MKTISIIIPAKDEATTLGRVLEDVKRVTSKLNRKYRSEVIVVDDHSTDNTASIARSAGFQVFSNMYRSGKGCALQTGLNFCHGDYIVMLDADYSHRAEEIPLVLQRLEQGAGMVIGSRILGDTQEYTWVRSFGNTLSSYLFSLLFRRRFTDILSGLKGFQAKLTKDVTLHSVDFEIEVELIALALRNNFHIVEIPSFERARSGGTVKSSILYHGSKIILRIFQEYVTSVIFSFRTMKV